MSPHQQEENQILTEESFQRTVSAYIKELKLKKRRYINEYCKVLPGSYTESSMIIKDEKNLKDIRDAEVKNRVMQPGEEPQIMLTSNEPQKKKEYYRTPAFLKIHHHKELTRIFEKAYSDHLKTQKPRNAYETLKLHDEAFKKAMEAMSEYPDQVYKNNERLIAAYPTVFSYENPEKTLLEEKKETKGLINKIQNTFKQWMEKK